MKIILVIMLIALASVNLVVAQDAEQAPAQEEQEEEASYLEYYTWEIVSSLVPIAFLFVFLYVVIRIATKRNRPYQQRLMEHTEKIEQKYDRIIDLLEEIVKKENKIPNHGLESTSAPPEAGTLETHP